MSNEDRTNKRVYRQPLNYENGIILPLIRDCCVARSIDPKAYQIDVQTLAMILPKDLRKNAFKFWNKGTIFEDLTGDGKKDTNDYFVFILEQLEDHNICFPKISYNVGHD